jgi:hypothetical protein
MPLEVVTAVDSRGRTAQDLASTPEVAEAIQGHVQGEHRWARRRDYLASIVLLSRRGAAARAAGVPGPDGAGPYPWAAAPKVARVMTEGRGGAGAGQGPGGPVPVCEDGVLDPRLGRARGCRVLSRYAAEIALFL